MKKILYTRQSGELQPIRALIEQQTHRTLVLWALDCARHLLPLFEGAYPQDRRPREAMDAAKAWARGEILMPEAKRAARATHAAAAEAADQDPAACAVAHAMGHVIGTVHVETHAIGILMYGLTACFHAAGPENAKARVAEELAWAYDRLLCRQSAAGDIEGPWAAFLLREDVPNKEALLRKKTEEKIQGKQDACP